MRQLQRSNGPGKVWTRETIFVKKKFFKSNFATVQWPLSLHCITAKQLNMAPILPILKILQKNIYIFHRLVLSDIFCFITIVVKWKPQFFYEKSAIWITFVKTDFVYLNLNFFNFQPLLVLKLKMPPHMKIIIFEILS